jgi:pimeloyl-ACP methyl ester carboxylesterase
MGSNDDTDDIETDARALIADFVRTAPRRRVRPRLAEPLRDAADHRIDTSAGPVMAWRLGSGPAVLLVHGWEDDNALWGPLIDRLQANGRAVVALDLPGHGFSPAEMDVRDAAGGAVKAVAAALGPMEAVVGHSFGCVALTSALQGGMVAERAALIASPIPRNRARALERLTARLENSGAPSEVADRALEIFKAHQVSAPPVFDIKGAAAGMTCKALIVHSMDDEICPPENARILADAWPGAELLWADGLGHRLVAQDAHVLERVVDFVEGFG